MHAEELLAQEEALRLFEQFRDPRNMDFARKHRNRAGVEHGRAHVSADPRLTLVSRRGLA